MDLLLKKKNKKGFLPIIAVIIALGILALILVGAFIFSGTIRWVLIGVGLFAAAVWILSKLKSDKFKVVGIFVLIALGVLVLFMSGIMQEEIGGLPSNVKLAIPHHGAYSCQSIGTGNPSYTINDIKWISKSSIGVYTDQVTNINVYVSSTFWESYFKSYLGGGIRAHYKICDKDQGNCQDYYKSITYAGNTIIPLPTTSLNPQINSFGIAIESRSTILSNWKVDTTLGAKAVLSYAYTKYGLKYVSTTTNPAGALFNGCESSCDLTCPTQKSRSDTGLIYTAKNSLLPTESVPVLEYWEDLNIDLNAQMGATIYDGNQFCFGGAIYTKGTINLDNGNTYIYPQMTTRQNVECCNGAVISTSQEDKTCTNNHWITVTKETRLKCVSDFNCPGQGQYTCQNKIQSGWHCGNDGFCNKEATNTPVECCSQADCPTDQTCQFNKCVGGAVTPPADLTNTTCSADTDCKNGYACKDGKCIKTETSCSWYQEPYQAQETQCKIFGLFWCKESPVSGCKTSGLIYGLIAGGVILILGISSILLLRKPKRGKRR